MTVVILFAALGLYVALGLSMLDGRPRYIGHDDWADQTPVYCHECVPRAVTSSIARWMAA